MNQTTKTPWSFPLSAKRRIEFERRIDKRRRKGGCWLWRGGCHNGKWHGAFNIGRGGKHATSHRLAYALWNGDIPHGMCVCHKCDNPMCCNPAHLWLGTHSDNFIDMHRKGRARPNCLRGADHPFRKNPELCARGERQACAKLTTIRVLNIRKRYKPGVVTMAELANVHGVSECSIRDVLTRKTWKHVP